MRLKKFTEPFWGVYKCMTAIIMWLPFSYLRLLYVKVLCKRVGKCVYISRNIDLRNPRNIIIGNNVVINKKVLLDGRIGSITIGNNVDIAQETNIWTLQHDPQDNLHGIKSGSVIIDDYVWIASRATILPGIKIGRGAVVATGAIVTKNVNSSEIVGGIPAKVIGTRNNDLLYTLTHKPWFE